MEDSRNLTNDNSQSLLEFQTFWKESLKNIFDAFYQEYKIACRESSSQILSIKRKAIHKLCPYLKLLVSTKRFQNPKIMEIHQYAEEVLLPWLTELFGSQKIWWCEILNETLNQLQTSLFEYSILSSFELSPSLKGLNTVQNNGLGKKKSISQGIKNRCLIRKDPFKNKMSKEKREYQKELMAPVSRQASNSLFQSKNENNTKKRSQIQQSYKRKNQRIKTQDNPSKNKHGIQKKQQFIKKINLESNLSQRKQKKGMARTYTWQAKLKFYEEIKAKLEKYNKKQAANLNTLTNQNIRSAHFTKKNNPPLVKRVVELSKEQLSSIKQRQNCE